MKLATITGPEFLALFPPYAERREVAELIVEAGRAV